MTGVVGEWRPTVRRVGRFAFGDRTGLALWLGAVVALALVWRVGFFVHGDEVVVANTFVNVADGHLAIRESRYPLSLQLQGLRGQVGLHVSDGRLYGRNYGQAFLTLPVLWGLRAATLVAPLHLVVAAGWSLGLLALSDQCASVLGRDELRPLGGLAALATFGVNALTTTPIDPALVHLVALQAGTLFATAFAGVLFYRLVAVFHDDRVALAAGVASVVALPVGFWASIPKRHVLLATLLIGAAYCFARSRRATGQSAYRSLAGAYVLVSLCAWVHALEGFYALAALATVDFLTGGVRDRKRLAVVALALLVGLAPMFLTNAAITGNPIEPPRLVPNQGHGSPELAPTGDVQVGTDGSSAGGDATGGSFIGGDSTGSDGAPGHSSNPIAVLLGRVLTSIGELGFVLGFVVTVVSEGVGVSTDPGRLWHVFGRSGRIPGLQHGVNAYEMIDLTVVESAPLLGGALALPFVAVERVRARVGSGDGFPRPWRLSGRHQTDLLVAVTAVLLTVVYLPYLPLHTQVTVRYLLPAMPFWLYAVVRLPPVRAAVRSSPKRLAVGYVAATLTGVVAASATLGALDVALGEAMQFHALVDLGVAAVVAGLVAGRTITPERVPIRWLTTALAVAAGLTTAFLFLAGVAYFRYGTFALGIGRWLSTAVPVF